MDTVNNDLELLVNDVNEFFKHLHDTQVMQLGEGVQLVMDESLWYYDDRLYYRYLAVNGSEEERDRFGTFLERIGVDIFKKAASWRAASNGRMYDWYFRVNDLTTADLTRISHYFGPRSDPSRGEEALARLFQQVAAQLDGKISAIMETVDETKRQSSAAERQLSFIAKQNEMLISLYSTSQQDLQQYRDRIVDLNERINDLHHELIEEVRGRTSHDELEAISARYEHALEDLQTDLARTITDRDEQLLKIAAIQQQFERAETEHEAYLAAFEPEKAALERQNTQLQNALAILDAQKAELLDRLQERSADVDTGKNNAESTWRETVGILLPYIELLGGTLDTLWREIEDPADALRDLSAIKSITGKRVRGLENGWFERHINRDHRLYWRCMANGGGPAYQAFIGAKNTQEHDIEWLKGV